MKYRVLLYYKFKDLGSEAQVQALKERHHRRGQELGLKGRVYLATEGLNGTVGGTFEACEAYKRYIETEEGFGAIHWKEDAHDAIPFAKLKTKARKTLVNLGEADVPDLVRFSGKRLKPSEWRKTLETETDFLLLDVRNRYESEVGRFKGAVCPDIENFHEFPKWVESLEGSKDRKILMYCTGGIRCEKFSGLLVQRGFKDVSQLDGGILGYAKEEEGRHFEGECFVFDDRLTVPVAQPPTVISRCAVCGTTESRYVNCSNMECNALFICCDACAETQEGACSEGCRNAPARRPFDRARFRIPYRKKGVVFPELGLAKVRG